MLAAQRRGEDVETSKKCEYGAARDPRDGRAAAVPPADRARWRSPVAAPPYVGQLFKMPRFPAGANREAVPRAAVKAHAVGTARR